MLHTWSSAIKKIMIGATSVRLTIDASAPPLNHLALGSVDADACDDHGEIVIDRQIQLARRGVGRGLILDDARTHPIRP